MTGVTWRDWQGPFASTELLGGISLLLLFRDEVFFFFSY